VAKKLFEYAKGTDKLAIFDTYIEYGEYNIEVPIKQIQRIHGGDIFALSVVRGSDFHGVQILSGAPAEIKEQAKEIL